MFDTLNITDLLFNTAGILILKIPFLLLILLYSLFLFIVMKRIKALNRTITVHAEGASSTLHTFIMVQLILAIILFVLTLFII